MTTTPVVLGVSDVRPIDLVSFPVGFTFRDDDGQAVITISDEPAEQHNHLEISNTSGGDLLLDTPPAGSQVSADHHHFELRFRPGVLSAASVTQMRVDDQAGWSATTPQTLADGTVSVYLLSAAARTFAMDMPLRFRLSAVGADGANGARGSQLELRFRLRFPDGTPLEDTKLLHIDLANQRGRKNIPLHVGFVGSHTVLNDGKTPNSLDVRITNAAPTELRLSGQDSPSPSRFIVSFDVSSGANDGDLGLASTSALAGMTLEAIDGHLLDGSDWVVEPGRQLGEGLAWTLTHKGKDVVLDAGQVIRLRLANIVTRATSGDTNLYLRYENIPGYWDGQFVCTIEKAPILYDLRGNVGVGTATPQHKLQVGDGPGALGIDPASSSADATNLRFGHALRLGRAQDSGGAVLGAGPAGAIMTVLDTGLVGIGPDAPNAPLTVQADSASSTEGRQIVVRGQAEARNELALGYQTGHDYGTIQAVTQGVAVRSLLLNPAGGRVGIGTPREPTAALEVNGAIHSPMFQVAWVINNDVGPLPVTSIPFASGGGTLLLFVSGSAYAPAPGLVGLQVRVDSRLVGSATLTPSMAGRVPLATTMTATGVPAGTDHRVVIEVLGDAPATRTDGNDLFSVTVLELPF